ncbi:unnamed protein product [Phytophthora lilii]|uniref:Unnamed protein product n=1 Tax=Phytophthora lilii TaxID=2077276 RepID=A0A9W6X9V7_9STRA|nr:unnamed protein product [Phytophthora lilii]
MKVGLCFLVLGVVVAQPPPPPMSGTGSGTSSMPGEPATSTSTGTNSMPMSGTASGTYSTTTGSTSYSTPTSDSNSRPDSASSSSSDFSSDSATTTPSTWGPTWNSYSSGSDNYGDVGYSSGSGWDWDGDAGWDPSSELWHFRPSWNWDSPYPPDGTMYIENWGNPPTPKVPSRRSFYFGAEDGVSLAGATVEGGRADCGWRDWCVHLKFHSSYGVLSDFDAFVLDRYDSADRIYGNGFWYAREDDEGPPRVFGPMVLGGFSPEERTVLENISKRKVEDMAKRFNETRTTTWTLYPDSDEMDVILSFKQLYTLLPGYPDGNTTDSAMNSDVISEWGASDQVLLRVTTKREGSGATSAMMPRVLNFTGSQLFQVEYYSSLEYPEDNSKNLSTAANAMTLDVVFGRRRYGSGLPWNPARPSDACDACNQRVMNHPLVARCLHSSVPEGIFQNIYEQSANELMEWDGGEWKVGDAGAPSNLSYNLNDVVDACFGLRWLLSGDAGDGSWSSDSSGNPNAGDRRSSSGSGFGDAGYRWSNTGSGSGRDYQYNSAGSGWTSDYRDPVYRYDESGSRWSSWGYRDDGSASRFGDIGTRWSSSGYGSASRFGDAGSRWSSSGSSGGPNAGDWPSVRDLRAALSIARETDTGIQCFVESRCPVGTRSFAEAAGRMVVMEHDRAFVRVNFSEPNYRFYIWMELEGLGPEGQFTTPELSSENSPDEIADLIAGAVPNASEYNLDIDVHIFNNSELIAWVNMLNEWMADYYKSGGSESEASAAWASYSASSDEGSSFQFPPVGESSGKGYPNVGENSTIVDGSSPDAGQDNEGPGYWWFAEPYPVPEPQFTVVISLRNVSVVPNILDVIAVGDDVMDGGSSNMSWDARGSELRFQLAPLNLSTFEYVPPPPYVNLTWNEDIPEYPDPYWNGSSIWNDTNVWSICSECADAYSACDNSTSCSIGVRAFLQEALSPSRFSPYELSDYTDAYNRRPWGVDIGPKLRQSAPFFTAEGYRLFMNFVVCLSQSACDLDLSRQAYSYSKGEYIILQPTKLELAPAESVFIVPRNSSGDLDSLVMKYRGKEYQFDFSYDWKMEELRDFILSKMNEHSGDEMSWTLDPYSVNVFDITDQYGAYGLVFNVSFPDLYFIETEQPRFRPRSSDGYNEIVSTHWKALIAADRNNDDEGVWDYSPLVTWRRLSDWLYDLGWDPNFGQKFSNDTIATEDIPICRQCIDSWSRCISNQSCAEMVTYNVLSSFSNERYQTIPRSSIDVSASFGSWWSYSDSHLHSQVQDFFSCLSAESCPVGYAMPSDPAASLVPVTTKFVSHFAVTLPRGKSVLGKVASTWNSISFYPGVSSVRTLEDWLQNNEVDVTVVATVNDDLVRYDFNYYPAVAEFPTFYVEDDGTFFELESAATYASFQLSSNRVQYGQAISWDLLNYWFGQYAESWRLFSYSGDIFSGPQVCHRCPECWEALIRCQNDMDCATSTREVLVPLLRNGTLPLSTNSRSDGRTNVKLDLSAALLSLENEAFQSREGWLAFAHLIHAMSSCGCEVGFGQWNSQGTYLEPTRVIIDSEVVQLKVRLYMYTTLDMWFSGNSYTYNTQEAGSLQDVANNFVNWVTLVANSDPFYIGVEAVDTSIDDVLQSALVTIKLYGLYDEASDSQPLVNPTWIPTFTVTSDDVSAEPPAEVIVTPWKISLQSTNRYPPFDRLLDLLEYGAVSDEIPSSNSSYGGSYSGGSYTSGSNGNGLSTGGSYTDGSSSEDACTRCESLRQACFDDYECNAAISNQLLPALQNMQPYYNDETGLYIFDDSGQILDGVFYNMQTLQAKQKLLAVLTCSAEKWTSTANQDAISCVQKLSDAEFPGVVASFEVTPARSTIVIPNGGELIIYTQSGTYNGVDYSDPMSLASYMENEVLGGYDNSGVRVEAYWNPGSDQPYTVIYKGHTEISTPHLFSENADAIRADSDDMPTQFKFSASTDDVPSIFQPWRMWLDPNN